MATHTNVLVYIARYNIEASVRKKFYLFSFLAFEHTGLCLVLNTKIPLAKRKRKRGEGFVLLNAQWSSLLRLLLVYCLQFISISAE